MNARVRGRAVKVDETRVRGGVAVNGTLRGLPVDDPAPAPTLDGATVRFTVPGVPIGKPRMTRSDKWKVGPKARPKVQRYRNWADAIRAAAGGVRWPRVLQGRLLAVIYLPIPPSYTEKQRANLPGTPHWGKPDGDNIRKGIQDALFEEDSFLWDGRDVKLWDDGLGPRVEVSLA